MSIHIEVHDEYEPAEPISFRGVMALVAGGIVFIALTIIFALAVLAFLILSAPAGTNTSAAQKRAVSVVAGSPRPGKGSSHPGAGDQFRLT